MSSKVTTKILNNLLDANDEKVLEILESFKEKGSKDVVVPLFDLLINNPSSEVETAIIDLFYGLKDTPARNLFLSEFSNKKYKAVWHLLLGVIWNADMNTAGHLPKIVSVGLSGNFEALVETYTIIETLEPPIEESELLECIVLCKNFANENPSSDKSKLVADMLTKLQELDEING